VSGLEVSAAIGTLIVQVAQTRGVDPKALAAATGFDPALGRDPDARIPLALETKLWDEASRRSGDDAFGLHAAELLRPGAFDVLDYAVRTAPDLRTALERLARYNRLVHDAAVFRIGAPRDGLVRVEHGFRTGAARPGRHASEFTIASLITIGSQIAQAPIRAHAVAFHHGRPSEAVVAEHRRFFGLEPRFAESMNAIVFDVATLERPVPAADPALSRIVERHAEGLLAARPEPQSAVADRVRSALTPLLASGDASLKTVAAKLKMNTRTLQRKLADEGVTFDAIVDELRRDLAERYLADPRIAISEVAYLLGFSEPSPFHRAFKRWTGMSPSEARGRAA